MKRSALSMTSATALLIALAVGAARGAAGPSTRRAAALLRRQPPRPADQPGARRRVQPDVDEREGLRRDLLGRELLVRSDRGVIVVPNRGVGAERADQQRVDLVHQPRRLGAHRALGRHPESRRPAQQHDAAARPERAARQRHRQRRALPRRSRRRHEPDRSGGRRWSAGST